MIKGILFDLDGTVYHGTAEVPGAADFVRQLPGWGIRPVFITNRANRTPEAVAEHLRSYGIACTTDDVLTSAQTTAQVLPKGSVYIIGEEGIRRALADAGFVEDDRHPDYVVVSYDRSFSYHALMQACRLVKAGARFVATNPDKYLTLEDGIMPGTGAIVAAVTACTGQEPMVIGKPQPLIFQTALKRFRLRPEETVAMGDNLLTDIPAGINAGLRTIFVTTGVSTRAELAASPCAPTWVVDSYAEVAAIIRAENHIA